MSNSNSSHFRLNSSLTGILTGSAMLTLAACGGGSGGGSSNSDSNLQSNLQGEWQAECETLAPELSARQSIMFSGSDIEIAGIFYVGATDCSNGNIFSLAADATFTIPNGTTETTLGAAQHINIETSTVEATSSQTLDAQLALQNTTFDQFLQNQLNIADASNINPQSLGLEPTLFSLALVDGDTLYLGDTNSNQGTAPETRLTELDQTAGNVYTRR